jgi:hypothetical protein
MTYFLSKMQSSDVIMEVGNAACQFWGDTNVNPKHISTSYSLVISYLQNSIHMINILSILVDPDKIAFIFK